MRYLILVLFLFSCVDEEECSNYVCWNGDVVCSPEDCPEQSENQFSVYYESDMPIAGFQFNINSIDIIGASGGSADAAGFTVSTGSNVVLGFSLSGSTIPAGSGLLTEIQFSGNLNDACLSNPIISDSSGNPLLAFIVDCNKLVIGSTVEDFFNHSTSDLIAFYFFDEVLINNQQIDATDWVLAFNGNICVGARQWDCISSSCDLPVYGYNSLNPLTDGYMLSGQLPSFKIYDTSNTILYDAISSSNIVWQDGSFNQIEILNAE
jgi:hypothetical protein